MIRKSVPDNYKESWTVLHDHSNYGIVKCRCNMCGLCFTADFHNNENCALHWHPRTNQECWMPKCPSGCKQTIDDKKRRSK